MLILFVRKIAIISLISCYCAGYYALAQYNYITEQRPYNLGFAMGLNFASVKLKTQNLAYQGEGPREIRVKAVPGINLGIINNFRLHYNLALRIIPSVSLQQRNFDFRLPDSLDLRRLEASYIDVPIWFQFKSNQYRHHRVYVGTGLKLSYNLMSDKRVRDNPRLIKIEKTDVSWISSFGINFIGDFIKLTPEITYAIGLSDIFVRNNSNAAPYIRSIFSQSIVLSLYFE
jgi:hypothetical protein